MLRNCSSPKTKPTSPAVRQSRTASSYVKDGINDYIVHGAKEAVNPEHDPAPKPPPTTSSRSRPGETAVVPPAACRLTMASSGKTPLTRASIRSSPSAEHEADEFYATVIPAGPLCRCAERHASGLRGMLWSKQFYHYVVKDWLEGDPGNPPPPPERRNGRNHEWTHLYNADVISMPDKWEYPWYAAWDLAFHCIPLALVDSDFAKEQLSDAARVVHASQRTDSRLRVGVRRRESSGACLGRLARLQDRQEAPRQRRPRVSPACLSQAAAEFHLVGEPQGRRRHEYFPGRLPGPGQHRRVRPQRAAADRRLHRAIRRHQLDGDVHPEPAGHRPGAGQGRSAPTKTWPASSGNTSSTSPTP